MTQQTLSKAINRGTMTTDDAKLATATTLAEALSEYDAAVDTDATLLAKADAAIAVIRAARLHVWAMQVHGTHGLEALQEVEEAEVE